ncbi:HPP family protein [Thiomicrorhabdus sp. Kp2]|uniref:CBS domain-containing protein n=1 Tax=Thiomicrorhabdus sp. Kp2 TaxID=1123518 RepID=UPI0003FFEE43|nr:CBS domain-containing protein [Thiomicrorhabdus sp. Kp2]
MFAIYNIEGRRFRDNLEKLKKVHSPHKNQQADFHQNIAQDETVIIQGTATEKINSQGIDAYRKMLHANERTQIFHAYQVMNHPVTTLPPETPIQEAYHLFKTHQVNQMPVSTHQMQLIGLVTIRDLLAYIIEDGDQISFVKNKTVQDAMSSEVITADPISDVRRIASVMLDYDVTAVPIVNQQDHLVGIVTRSDLLKAMLNDPPLSLWS